MSLNKLNQVSMILYGKDKHGFTVEILKKKYIILR